MLQFAFWFLYLCTPAIIVFLLNIAGERINRVSLVNIVTLSVYAFSIVGTMPLFYLLDEYRVATGVVDKTLIFEILLLSSINIIFMLIGVIFVRRIIGVNSKSINRTIQKLTNKQMIILIALLVISVSVAFLYILQLDNVALFVALELGAKEAGVARSLMGNDFSGKYHWYHLFMNDISQVVVFSTFAIWLTARTKPNLILFIFSFLYASFVAIIATEKGPMSWLIIGLFFIYILVIKKGSVPAAEAFKFIPILIVPIILMYLYFTNTEDLFSAFSNIISRSFTGQITPGYFYLQYFPGVKDYLWGGTFPNPGGIFPFRPFEYTVELMNWVFPEVAASGVVGSMPTVFWAESYANFGIFGIPVIAIVVGFFLAIMSRAVGLLEWNPISIGFYAWMIIHYKDLSGTGFSNYFVDASVLIIFSIVLSINIIGKNVRLI